MVSVTNYRGSVREIIDNYGSTITLHPIDITTNKWGDKTEIADERAIYHLKMNDDATSTTVTDSSGRGNDGTASRNTNQFKSIINWLKLNGNTTDSSDKDNDGTTSTATIIDDCEDLTNWTTQRCGVTLNTTTFAEGSAAVNYSKTVTDSKDTYFYPDFTPQSLKYVTINHYVYVKDQATLDKIEKLQFYAFDQKEGYTWHCYVNVLASELGVGWNVASYDLQNLDGESGSVDLTSVGAIRIDVDTNNVTDTIAQGDLIFDEISYGKPLKCKDRDGNDLSAYQFNGNRHYDTDLSQSIGSTESIKVVATENGDLDLDYTKSFSYGCWFYLDDFSYNSNAACLMGPSGYSMGLQYDSNGSLSTAVRVDSTAQAATYGTALEVDTWYHAFVTYDAESRDLCIYVGGNLEDTKTTTLEFDTAGLDWFIGKGGNWGGNTSNVHGKILDCRIYDRALTSTEVETLYNNGTILTTNPLDDGKVNGAFYANNDGHIELGALDLTSYTGLTLATWVKPTSFQSYHSICDNESYNGGLRDGWVFRISNIQDINFVLADTESGGGAGESSISSTTLLNKDEWAHVVATWDGTTMLLYINGSVELDTDTWDGTIPNHGDVCSVMGLRTSNNFQGYVDDFRLYDYALSATEVTELYNSGSGTEEALSTNTTTSVGVPYDIMVNTFNFQRVGDLVEADLILIVKDTEDVFASNSERRMYITYKNVDYDVISVEKYMIKNVTLAKQVMLKKRQ